mgnify:CR=1 FL=1
MSHTPPYAIIVYLIALTNIVAAKKVQSFLAVASRLITLLAINILVMLRFIVIETDRKNGFV